MEFLLLILPLPFMPQQLRATTHEQTEGGSFDHFKSILEGKGSTKGRGKGHLELLEYSQCGQWEEEEEGT